MQKYENWHFFNGAEQFPLHATASATATSSNEAPAPKRHATCRTMPATPLERAVSAVRCLLPSRSHAGKPVWRRQRVPAIAG